MLKLIRFLITCCDWFTDINTVYVSVFMCAIEWNPRVNQKERKKERKSVLKPTFTSNKNTHTTSSFFYCGALSPRPCAIQAELSRLSSKSLSPSISI